MTQTYGHNREYGLDLVKISATILIVFHHYQQVENVSFPGYNFYNGTFYWGWLVELFFMLSGYFILRYVEKILDGGTTFKEYFLHRYLRLMPLMAITVVSFQVLQSIYQQITSGSPGGELFSFWKTVIASLGIQRGWGFSNSLDVNNPLWYLSVLIQCYIFFYFVTYLARRTKSSPWIGIVYWSF